MGGIARFVFVTWMCHGAGPCSEGAVDGAVEEEDFRLGASLPELCLLPLELLTVDLVLGRV